MKVAHIISLLSFMLFAFSCGKAKDNSPSGSTPIQEAEDAAARAAADGSNILGSYLAKFQTLNPHVVGTIPGSAQIRREGNRLQAFVRLFAGSPDIAHFQNIHTGTRCPLPSDDSNGDGYIDIQEAYAVVGPIIVPLDWDIGSQLSANRSWPKAFPNGSYEYTKETSFDRFWRDLKDDDSNTSDNITKLAVDQGFPLVGRVVLIQGVAEDKNLPDTVAGNGRWKNFQTLPIVCGIFSPYTPNALPDYSEGIPGPVADVEEGQDRPAPVGEGEIPGSGTVISGPSNEAGSNTADPDEEQDPDTLPSPGENGPGPTDPETEPDNGGPIPEEEEEEDDDDGGICWPWETNCR